MSNAYVENDGDLEGTISKDGQQPEDKKIRLYTMPEKSFEVLTKCDKCKIKFNKVTKPSEIIFPNNRIFRAIFNHYGTGEIDLDNNGKIIFPFRLG